MLAATMMMGTSVPDKRYSIETRSGKYSTDDMEANRLRNFANNITLGPKAALLQSPPRDGFDAIILL
ncbi:MAG: hypothetical protein Q8K27_00025 [Betaproteobacteria bacterium]|jgi:hypothetical protein|nr:hypothetical protein [Betaproteobacteria bacterium]